MGKTHPKTKARKIPREAIRREKNRPEKILQEKKLRIGIYPGTFDPITYGHLDIIRRAASLVDSLIVAVSSNAGKEPLFPLEVRIKLVENELEHNGNIKVMGFDNLLMHFAMEQRAKVIIRGLRAVTDFEYEFQMAGMNHRLNSDIETIFLMASERHQFISSRFVKEIGRLGGNIESFVPLSVAQALKRSFSSKRPDSRE